MSFLLANYEWVQKTSTINQHYVRRKYLSEWADDNKISSGHIWSLDKNRCKIFEANLTKVCVERLTYDISKITKDDKKLALELFKYWISIRSKELVVKNFFETISTAVDFIEKDIISKIEDLGVVFLQKIKEGKFPFDPSLEISAYINYLKWKLIYKIFYGSKNELDKNEPLNAIENYKDERFDFFYFLSNQFFRTIYAKEIFLDVLGVNDKEKADAECKNCSEQIFPLLMFLFTFFFAYGVTELEFCV